MTDLEKRIDEVNLKINEAHAKNQITFAALDIMTELAKIAKVFQQRVDARDMILARAYKYLIINANNPSYNLEEATAVISDIETLIQTEQK